MSIILKCPTLIRTKYDPTTRMIQHLRHKRSLYMGDEDKEELKEKED